jgi:hypothetical protein
MDYVHTNISRSELVRYVVGSYGHFRVTAIRHVEVGAWITSGLPTNRTLSLRQGALVMVKNWETFAECERRIPLVSFFAQRLSQSYARRRYAW